ncbi:APC family permease [Luteolibacter sp. AS25]|uniref:APC family permease n=1 Tax=Luteolibacter sp. AS25 TaxID=3135776 RepID=UPI00398A88A7
MSGSPNKAAPAKSLGTPAATSLVVANMIGTGVFISLGFQLLDFNSAPPIMFLWLAGGIISLCGALSYATLAGLLPRSGGEYHFLSQTFHPSLGFMAGLLSAIVGFAVPTAITALAMGGYLSKAWPEIPARGAAVAVILIGGLAHGISARTSGRVQLFSTSLKLLLIFLFLVSVIVLPGKGDIRWEVDLAEDLAQIGKPAFATAIFFVFYAYSGWNAAVYGLEEWNEPGKTVRRSLVGGTLLVTLLYIGLNAAFLLAAPVAELTGQQEIAHVAAASLFGDQAGRMVSGLFAMGLFASVSALLWAGPRVLATMGRDVHALRFFASGERVPLRSLGFQVALAIALVIAGDFEALINYTQTGLALCTFLAVFGLFILKLRGKKISALELVPALIFVAFTGFVIIRMFVAEPISAISGFATAIICALLWFPTQWSSK